ncbi:type II toxin-antitoxin system VapC family toxin [Aeoliella mucimassa]|uniref:Ribonuclease VapC n=1 Tax=Aeoliella mucimassa TaxID=2527972 RepID=A0A518ATR0_9BACT|nr:type II toxin-antitoxin system VapC family toxin [Aeoliella mucimassa]QDU58086.1 tRNA(fMet)-specific endonuclease VapC [Aeoliella mucimassa]
MAWLPDTNVWINLLKQPGSLLERKVLSHSPDQILLCSIVKAELWHGAQKYGRTDRRLSLLDKLFAQFASLPFDDEAARHYADIRHQLESIGAVIGPNDLKIAAICRSTNLVLVTANLSEFSRVEGLQLEDWTS